MFEGTFDVSGHDYVHGAQRIFQGDGQTAVVTGLPIFGDLIMFFQCSQEVVTIGTIPVSNSKVINGKGETDVAGSMCPEAWCDGGCKEGLQQL